MVDLSEEDKRKLVAERLKHVLQQMPPIDRGAPIIVGMGNPQNQNISMEQLLREVEAGTEVGRKYVEADIKKFREYGLM